MKPMDAPCRLLLAFLLLAWSAHGAAPETGKEKLRTLVRLPTLNMQAGFGFDSMRGFKLITDARDFPAEIAALRKQLVAAPSDGALQFQLGKLLREAGEPTAAMAAFTQAVALYRARLEAQPANGPLLTSLAEALAETDKAEEAESRFREAVRLAPKEWKCWFGLAAYAGDQASAWLVQELHRRVVGVEQLAAHLASHKPTPEQIRRSQEWLRESKAAFDRAVELAPEEPEVFLRRGLNTGLARFIENCIAWVRGEGEPPNIVRGMYSPDALPDFKQAARLAPQSYRINATALLFELGLHAALQPDMARQGPLWNILSDSARQSVGHGLARLERIAESERPRDAAGALELLGLFHVWVQGDTVRASACCQRAVALDPAREQAWDVLAGLAASEGKDEDLLRVCEARVRQRDTARNRIALAKTLFRLKRMEQAAGQVKLALQRSPDDFIARLTQAALLLRRSGDADALAEAGRLLRQGIERREDFARKSKDDDQTRYTMIDLVLLSAICAALEDDFTTAHLHVKQVLDMNPNHPYAKEIQSALGK